MTRRALTVLCAACATLGCGSSSTVYVQQHSTNPRGEARFIGEPTLALIQRGETTEEWVHNMLGKPSSVQIVFSSQRKIVRYEYEPVRSSGTTVYRILDESDRRGRIIRAIHFEIAQGIVQNWWIE
ncbi:MAG: hypothetical protein ACF8GE_11080 [Phycisphaerales bacterium JB043]